MQQQHDPTILGYTKLYRSEGSEPNGYRSASHVRPHIAHAHPEHTILPTTESRLVTSLTSAGPAQSLGVALEPHKRALQ
jgi:hypothetical protein